MEEPIPVAARSETHVVLDCSNVGIVDSTPAHNMDILLVFFCVMFSCVGRCLKWADPPSQES